MILPIVGYGSPILRKECETVENFEEINKLIEDMWETMEHARGCGLAAPQVNKAKRIFVVDSKTTFDYIEPEDRQRLFEGDEGIREVFINAEILEYSAEEETATESCLSLPGVEVLVPRARHILIQYDDENGIEKEASFSGITARMIQHEYDHVDGILHIDRIAHSGKLLISNKLKQLQKGYAKATYMMKWTGMRF